MSDEVVAMTKGIVPRDALAGKAAHTKPIIDKALTNTAYDVNVAQYGSSQKDGHIS